MSRFNRGKPTIVNTSWWLGAGLAIAVSAGINAHAQSLYKWVDESGNVTYQDTPPPGDIAYEEQVYSDPETGPSSTEEEIENYDETNLALLTEESPVTLYSVPDCDSCDLVRLLLDNNEVPYTEKEIHESVSMQQELMQLSGKLEAPTVVIGDIILDGYSKSALTSALEGKGYPLGGRAASAGDNGDQAADGELTDAQLGELTNVFDDQVQGDQALLESDEDLVADEIEDEEVFDEEPVIEISN